MIRKDTLGIARVADLVVQPTGASVDDLRPAVREFDVPSKRDSQRAGIALNRIGTPNEEAEVRRPHVSEAGYT